SIENRLHRKLWIGLRPGIRHLTAREIDVPISHDYLRLRKAWVSKAARRAWMSGEGGGMAPGGMAPPGGPLWGGMALIGGPPMGGPPGDMPGGPPAPGGGMPGGPPGGMP